MVVVGLTVIANHTAIIENAWELVIGDYVSGVAPFVESYLLTIIISLLLRKSK